MIEEARLRRIERSLQQLLTRDYLIGEGARVYNSANISIADNTATALTFDTERFDYGDYHSTSTNTERFTVPVDGVYIVSANIQWASNSTGYRQLTIRVDGSTVIARERYDATASNNTDQNITTIYMLSATSYLEVVVRQTSGGNLNVNNGSDFSPEFAIWRVG